MTRRATDVQQLVNNASSLCQMSEEPAFRAMEQRVRDIHEVGFEFISPIDYSLFRISLLHIEPKFRLPRHWCVAIFFFSLNFLLVKHILCLLQIIVVEIILLFYFGHVESRLFWRPLFKKSIRSIDIFPKGSGHFNLSYITAVFGISRNLSQQ